MKGKESQEVHEEMLAIQQKSKGYLYAEKQKQPAQQQVSEVRPIDLDS